MDRLRFSSMLREYPQWSLLQQSFSLSQGVEITETTNIDFDLCLENNVSKNKVIAKLVDPSTIIHSQDSAIKDWSSRIIPDARVVLLLPADDPRQQTLALQMLQLQFLGLYAAATVLLIPHINQVLSTLKTYANSNGGIGPSTQREFSPVEVIPFATSSAPRVLLSDNEAHTIQKICGSIAGLELYTRSREGQNRLSQLLDPALVNSMVEFWQDEWVV